MSKVRINDPFYAEAVEFLFHEAELLDNGKFHDWLGLMADDLVYQAPVSVTDSQAGPVFVDDGHFLHDNLETLTQRVKRLESGFAWSENPPSSTRRLISNIRLDQENMDQLLVKSNFLLYRTRSGASQAELIAGERQDTLRRVDGNWRLARRKVLLTQPVMGVKNLGVFF